MRREIHLYPDPVLRQRSEPILKLDDEIRALADEMVETLILRVGYGLAAPQVSVTKRLIIVDVEDELYIVANPEIVKMSAEKVLGIEGCLSIPGIETEIERAKQVRVEGLTLQNEKISVDAEGLLARVFQHEVDHLNGILFIDHVGRAKRQLLLKEYEKLKDKPKTKARAKALL
ncbi:MAG: peptide deformylase [Candidatus Fraserbacteria bacterium RBG_16_55_9]|uniref:Peptide deformylase n=1 Tax=Fraserbacteria sp. (strain RBG_16_55_9) TaxID=1817864 RepID=A0A1F5UWJ9_FRAXR|nr:MAG: peptide deformylase [Candidatus Fraserbacteria bacterium RBG_16_55_9]